MTRTLLTAAVLVAACASKTKNKKMPATTAEPELGRIAQLYDVLDEKDRTLLGYIEKVKYDSGRVLYWIYGPRRQEKLGYIQDNGRAFRIELKVEGGTDHVDLGADSHAVGARRVLEASAPVVLIMIDEKEYFSRVRERLGLKQPAAKTDDEGE
jgi:hypothetical protein